MDFSQVGVAKTTSFDGFIHPEIGECDIVVHGITAAHEDYEALVAKHNPPRTEGQRVYFNDDDERSVEVKYDPEAEKRMRHLLAAMVTGIDGFTGWEYSPEATRELFDRADCSWLVKQWKRHLEDEGKSSKKPAPKRKRGPKS